MKIVIILVLICSFVIVGCTNNSTSSKNQISKKQSSDGPPTEAEVEKELKAYYETCIPLNEWDDKKAELSKASKSSAWNVWKRDKNKCDITSDDKFIKFKKTDGKAEDYSALGDNMQYYTIYGELTMFNAKKAQETVSEIEITFEKRESGWVETNETSQDYVIGIAQDFGIDMFVRPGMKIER